MRRGRGKSGRLGEKRRKAVGWEESRGHGRRGKRRGWGGESGEEKKDRERVGGEGEGEDRGKGKEKKEKERAGIGMAEKRQRGGGGRRKKKKGGERGKLVNVEASAPATEHLEQI